MTIDPTFFDLADIPYVVVDATGKYVAANESFTRNFGWTLEDVLAAEPFFFTHPEDVARTLEEYGAAVRGEPVRSLENRTRTKSGRYLWVRWQGFFDPVNQCAYCIGRDITAEKEAHEQLIETQNRLNSVVADFPGVIYQWTEWPNGEGGYTFVSPGCEDIFGVKPEDLMADWRLIGVSDEELPRWEEKRQATNRTMCDFWFESECKRPDGTSVWWRCHSKPRMYGQNIVFTGVMVDITKEKKAEEKLREVTSTVPAMIFQFVTKTDGDWRFTFVSESLRALQGLDPQAVVDDPMVLFERIEPEHLKSLLKAVGERATNPTFFQHEVQVNGPRGKRWVRLQAVPIRESENTMLWNGFVHDIDDEKQVSQRLAASEELFRLVAKAANDGIWDFKLDTGKWWCSDRWKEQIGYRADELTDSVNWQELIDPRDLPRLERLNQEMISGKRDSFVESIRFRHKQGHTIHILVRTFCQRDAEGRPFRLVGSHTDISELVDARQKAEEANRAKGQFLTNVSHEIRTPMNGVLGLTGLLLETPLNEKQREYAEAINSSGTTLLHLLNDILDLGKAESGNLGLIKEAFSLAELVEEVAKFHAPNAADKGISFSVEIGESARSKVIGDPHRLRQVLNNLVANALKFTNSGFVKVILNTEIQQSVAQVVLEVRDSGIGIPEDRLNVIFEPFMQADNSTSRSYGGTGLGLAIVRDLVRLMGGVVETASTVGEGSAFTVRLMLPIAAVQGAELPSHRYPKSLAGVRALLVEDNAVNVMVATGVLRRLGCEVTSVPNGFAAIEAVRGNSYDIVFMDLHMPGMDGTATTRALRREGFCVPIVAVTAAATAEDRDRCLLSGMNAFVSKPFRPDTIYQVIAQGLGLIAPLLAECA